MPPTGILSINMPAGRTLLALTPLLLLAVGLIVYSLVDLVRAPRALYLPKPVWALIIILGSAPLGPLAYLLLGRDRRGHEVPDADSGGRPGVGSGQRVG